MLQFLKNNQWVEAVLLRVDYADLFPTPHLFSAPFSETSCWHLEIGHSGSFYMAETSESYNWCLSFSFSRSWKYSLIAQQRRINCPCVFTQRKKIFLIVFAIPSHAMTSILIILHGVSWFKKLSLPAVSVKRFSGAVLGKSNSAFKCCIFADII